jgi:hypothetical protein
MTARVTGVTTESSVASVGSAKALHPGSGPGAATADCPPARIAERLQARRTGPGRWLAKCPAHADRSPSLSIATGRDGRALVRCFAGCELNLVLKAAGLTIADLFANHPRKPEQRAIATVRDRLHAEQRAQRASERAGERAAEDWLRLRWQTLHQALPRLARTLALMPDNAPGAFALTNHFHHVLAETRFIDRAISGETE